MAEQTVHLDGEVITIEQLNEKRRNLPNGVKIVEVAPNVYTTLERMDG